RRAKAGVPGESGDSLARGAVYFIRLHRTTPDRRHFPGQCLVVIDQDLVPQAVRRRTELPARDSESLQHVVEPPQVSLQVTCWIAHVGVRTTDHALRELHRL